jgi:chemotaxis protein MotB
MKTLIALSIACAAAGCVSQSKYDDLKARYDKATHRLVEGRASVSDARVEIKKLRDANEVARDEIEMLDNELYGLEQEHRALSDATTRLLQERARLKQSNNELEEALRELADRKAEVERSAAEFRSLVARFKSLIDAGTLKVAMSRGRMVLQLPTDVLFDSGSAKLSKVGKAAMIEVAAVLKTMPERPYQVEGHTDDVPIHTSQFASNWELAAARSLGVIRALTDAGMTANTLSAASYAEHAPVASNADEAGRRENRRIELILVPDLSLLPGYEELQRIVQPS